MRPDCDLIVVGAGVAGLHAAHVAERAARAPLTGTAVRAIEAHADGLAVHTMQSTLRAAHVLVAVSPPVAARIGFAWLDAAAVRSALDSWIAGDVIKFHVFCARAFWRDAGLSGAAAGKPTAWHETVWIDHPWYGGAYRAHLRAGADPDATNRPMERSGRIRFAVAELTHYFHGCIEGALHSAERALAGVCAQTAHARRADQA